MTSSLTLFPRTSSPFARTLQLAQQRAVFAGRKVVGHVEDSTLVKHVKASRHQLRHPLAWAVDEKTLRQAAAMGATSVRICDDESGRTWEAPLSDFLGGASFALDRGFGKQRALALNSPAWKKGLN